MRGFLAKHLGVFAPDDIRILTAAFDKAWEAVQASGVVYPQAKAEAARAILAKHIIAAAMHGERDHADYVMALYWLWLNQIYGPRPIRCAKPLEPKSPSGIRHGARFCRGRQTPDGASGVTPFLELS